MPSLHYRPLIWVIKVHISVKKTLYSEVMHRNRLLICICLYVSNHTEGPQRGNTVLWFDMLLRCDTAQWFSSTPPHRYAYTHIASTGQFRHSQTFDGSRRRTFPDTLGKVESSRAQKIAWPRQVVPRRNLFLQKSNLFRQSAIIILNIFIYREKKKNCMSPV